MYFFAGFSPTASSHLDIITLPSFELGDSLSKIAPNVRLSRRGRWNRGFVNVTGKSDRILGFWMGSGGGPRRGLGAKENTALVLIATKD